MVNYLAPGVYVEEVEAGSRPVEGVGTAVAAFVGLAERGPLNTPVLVTNWTQYVTHFGDFLATSYLAHAVYGYFQNGGSICYVVRVGGDGQPAANGSNGSAGARKGKPALPRASASLGGYRVTVTEAAAGRTVRLEVADPTGENPPEGSFDLGVQVDGKPAETYQAVSTKRGPTNVLNQVKTSKLIEVEEAAAGGVVAAPPKGTVDLVPPPPEAAAPTGSAVEPAHYIGDAADRTGFSGLEAVDEVTSVAVPDLAAALEQGEITDEDFRAVQTAMIAHCELMGDRIAILDPPPALSPQQIAQWRRDEAGYDSKYAALYYPWIKVHDPATGSNRFVPPCGHMAGVWARTDATRGVHKAPANEVVRGAVSLQMQITQAEQELLNPSGINCIRAFPNRGVRVWGARTLSSDAAWRYLNVRRLFNYLEESILVGTQWVVFEPNDPALWARIRRTISAFLINEWRMGALFGLTPDEAFFVKCDSETNTAESIDAGRVICQVGVAPVKPAEFVVFELSQFSGGTSLVNE